MKQSCLNKIRYLVSDDRELPLLCGFCNDVLILREGSMTKSVQALFQRLMKLYRQTDLVHVVDLDVFFIVFLTEQSEICISTLNTLSHHKLKVVFPLKSCICY